MSLTGKKFKDGYKDVLTISNSNSADTVLTIDSQTANGNVGILKIAGDVAGGGLGAGEQSAKINFFQSAEHICTISSKRSEPDEGELSFQTRNTSDSAPVERFIIKKDGKIINQSGIYQVGTQTNTNATGWNFETSSASTISCAQNTAVKIGNVTASGFIIINDTTVTGQAAVIVTGGGVVSVVGQTGSQFVSSSSPSTSQVGIYNAGGYVTIKNGKSSTMGISLMTFRTRTGQ